MGACCKRWLKGLLGRVRLAAGQGATGEKLLTTARFSLRGRCVGPWEALHLPYTEIGAQLPLEASARCGTRSGWRLRGSIGTGKSLAALKQTLCTWTTKDRKNSSPKAEPARRLGTEKPGRFGTLCTSTSPCASPRPYGGVKNSMPTKVSEWGKQRGQGPTRKAGPRAAEGKGGCMSGMGCGEKQKRAPARNQRNLGTRDLRTLRRILGLRKRKLGTQRLTRQRVMTPWSSSA